MIVLNEAKPKYEKLDEILEEKLTNIRFLNQVTIIIDLKEILRKFFRPDISAKNYNTKTLIEEISADVMNTVGHYRNYFYKKGKYTNFYILDSMSKSSELDSFYPGYREEFYEKYSDIISTVPEDMTRSEFENMLPENDFKRYICQKVRSVISIVAKMFPHVYPINTSDVGDVVYSKLIIENTKSNELIFIVSNDEIMFQLVSDNVSVITPKGIKSELITNKNLYQIVSKKDDLKTELSIGLYPLVLSLAGVKKHSIKNVQGIGFYKAIVLVESLLKLERIENVASIAIPIQYSSLNDKIKGERIIIENKDLINLNYNIIKGDIFLNRNKKLLLNKITADHYRKYLKDDIKKLNEKIFTTVSLQFDMLLRGEKI